jgi:hypothetical protein
MNLSCGAVLIGNGKGMTQACFVAFWRLQLAFYP